MQRCHEMRAGACVKERSEQRWRRQCVRLQGGGAAVQQACLSAAWHGEVRRRASMGPAHLAWMWVGSRASIEVTSPKNRKRRNSPHVMNLQQEGCSAICEATHPRTASLRG